MAHTAYKGGGADVMKELCVPTQQLPHPRSGLSQQCDSSFPKETFLHRKKGLFSAEHFSVR